MERVPQLWCLGTLQYFNENIFIKVKMFIMLLSKSAYNGIDQNSLKKIGISGAEP